MENKIAFKYIGQATTLLTINGIKILTDPHFAEYAFIFKRKTKLNVDPSSLPEPSAILISHTHFDHLNIKSFKYISQNIPVIIPEGCEGAITKFIANPVIELSLFATHRLPDGTLITAVPVKHRGGRFCCFKYKKANSYLITKNESTIYFCGDSAYGPHFKDISGLARIDLAVLPIESYFIRRYMMKKHMDLSESIKAFDDLKAKHMIPIHWGTFFVTPKSPEKSLETLKKILTERPDLSGRVHIVSHGEEFELPSP